MNGTRNQEPGTKWVPFWNRTRFPTSQMRRKGPGNQEPETRVLEPGSREEVPKDRIHRSKPWFLRGTPGSVPWFRTTWFSTRNPQVVLPTCGPSHRPTNFNEIRYQPEICPTDRYIFQLQFWSQSVYKVVFRIPDSGLGLRDQADFRYLDRVFQSMSLVLN